MGCHVCNYISGHSEECSVAIADRADKRLDERARTIEDLVEELEARFEVRVAALEERVKELEDRLAADAYAEAMKGY